MTGWKRICCAVEFSEPSRVAMLQAAELATRCEGDLVLLHVKAPPPPVAPDALATPEEAGSLELVDLERTVAAWREEAARVAGRPVAAEVLDGEPAEEIVRFSRERDCDLLVIGTHGRTGVKRLVLGSVAEKVVRTAACPVLVARRREPAAAAGA